MDLYKELLPQKGQIPPQTIAAAGSATSGWIKAEDPRYIVGVNLGALGGGSVQLSFEQANTSGGGGAKALSWEAGAAQTVNDSQLTVENEASKLDQQNGFFWFRAKLANTGGTGALSSATVRAAGPRYR